MAKVKPETEFEDINAAGENPASENPETVTAFDEGGELQSMSDILSRELELDEAQRLEEERVEKEEAELEAEERLSALEAEARKQFVDDLRRQAADIAFRDTKVAEVFSEKFIPIIEGLYSHDQDLAERVKSQTVMNLVMLGLLAENGCDVFAREYTNEVIEEMAPHVAKRIQYNLDMLRPRGLHSARMELLKMYSEKRNSFCFHIRTENGISPTAYEYISGNEEYLLLRVNPKVGSDFCFFTENGGDFSLTAPHSRLPDCITTLSWNLIDDGGLFMAKKIKLVDGKHPTKKGNAGHEGRQGQQQARQEPPPPVPLTNLQDAPDAIFNGITRASIENYSDAIALCQQFDINPSSIGPVMVANGYVFSEQMNAFVKQQTPTMTANQDQNITMNDQDNDLLDSELTSLASFLPR